MTRFDEWRSSVTPLLAGGGARTAARYAVDGRLSHLTRLSDHVLKRFQSEALAKAAFLHGVDPSDAGLLEHIPDVSPEVRILVDDRNRLRSLGTQGSSHPAPLGALLRPVVHDLLRSGRDQRAVILFVIEQLQSLDEWGELAAWQRRFVDTPELCPSRYESDPNDRFANRSERGDFLRHVVAPVAEAVGLWQERNLAENLALLQTDEVLFHETVVNVIQSANDPDGVPARVLQSIRPVVPRATVKWQWRHVDSIVRRHARRRPHVTTLYADRAGYVLVVRPTSQRYAALASLHANFEHVPDALRDLAPTKQRASSYVALHTKLVLPGKHERPEQPVSIHIVDAEQSKARMTFAATAHLRRIAASAAEPRRDQLRVFAFDGRAVYIPHGGTVLNFAYTVHNGFVARLLGATVNRRSVPLLHRLRDGDIVWLDISDELLPLPENWQTKVPEGTRRKIEQAYAAAMKPALVDEGRRWLQRRLLLETGMDLGDRIDGLLDNVNRAVLPRSLHATSALLLQYGLIDRRERGMPSVQDQQLDGDVAESIVEGVVARARADIHFVNEFNVPLELRERAERIVACTLCGPRTDEDIVATLVDETLEIHRKWAPCASDGVVLPRVRRAVERQYYVIETTNRAGIGAEVLKVFSQNAVDIEEISGRRLGTGWGIIRCGIDYASASRRGRLVEELRAIPDVRRVIDPDSRPVPLLEDLLPHRADAAVPLWTKAPPFQVGPALEDDRLFYGMEDQVAALEHAFRRAVGAQTGECVFVQGPLRTGKSSIVKRFLRVRERDHHRPSIVVYEFAQGKTWREVVESVHNALQRLVGRSLPAGGTIEYAIRDVRATERTPIILAIDEAVGVFATATTDDVRAILAFADALRRTASVLLIFVGPTAPLRYADVRLAHLLQSATAVPVANLTHRNVHRLLSAEQLAGTYHIAVPEAVSNGVHALTHGNPYWVAELATLMFSENDHGLDATDVDFTEDLLSKAVALALRRGLAFLDRRPQGPIERAIVIALLTHAPQTPIPTACLSDAVSSLIPEASNAAFAVAIDALDQRGALLFEDGWRIATPLLERYLRREFERST